MTNSSTPFEIPMFTGNKSYEDPYKLTQFYTVPSGLPDKVLDALCEQCEGFENNMELSTIRSSTRQEQVIDESIRVSKTHWIPTDHWIAAVMAHSVREANNSLFKFNLTRWSERIQYTVYDGKGSNYGWHQDTAASPYNENEIRKLSISLVLSDPDDYEAGELQLLSGKQMSSYRAPKGTAIVFPSPTTHRVRPLKSGIRRSLVGWYGGPPWR